MLTAVDWAYVGIAAALMTFTVGIASAELPDPCPNRDCPHWPPIVSNTKWPFAIPQEYCDLDVSRDDDFCAVKGAGLDPVVTAAGIAAPLITMLVFSLIIHVLMAKLDRRDARHV